MPAQTSPSSTDEPVTATTPIAAMPSGTDLARTVSRAHLFHLSGDAVAGRAAQHLISVPDGAVAVDASGIIVYSGPYDQLPQEYSEYRVLDHRGGFILPGFVDAHMHYPQTFLCNAYGGGQLLEWLERCIFPGESRYSDPEYAAVAAETFCRNRIAVGTTAAMVFGSAFPVAQDALFEASVRHGLRIVSGRGIQTVGPSSADALITDEDTAIELAADEVLRWHGGDLTDVALVPRFSLSVTRRTLAALGELYESVRGQGVYFHSHLSENDRPVTGEVAAVRAAYEVADYLDTYDGRFLPGSDKGGHSLLGPRSILAHAVHCTDRELARMAETGTSIAHCPTSQLFLGSGTMPWRRTVAHGVTIALGSDVGAGDEWSIARVASDSYKVHMSEPGADAIALDPAELLLSATLAGARALDRADTFGNLEVGKQADLLVVEPALLESLGRSLEWAVRADDEEMATAQTLFALVLGLRPEAIAGVYVRGVCVSDRA